MTDRIAVAESSAYIAWAAGLLSEEDRSHIVDVIAENPEAGVVIKGTGGLRKLRVALPGLGKRGGGRLIYWFYTRDYPAVLLFAFAKNEAHDLSADRRKQLARLAATLVDSFGGGQ